MTDHNTLDLDLEDQIITTGTFTGTPIAALREMHDRAVDRLEPYAGGVDPYKVIYRVRDASRPAWNDTERRHQVTIRYKTAGGATAREWERCLMGDALLLVYGWLDGDEVKQVVVLDVAYLVEDTLDRPGCLVPPDARPRAVSRATMAHHAPGGAEFLVVDIRRVTERCVVRAEGPVEWATSPADVAYQEGLFPG